MDARKLIEAVVAGVRPRDVLAEVYTTNFGGRLRPRSLWDRVSEHERPFDWSTPAPNYKGEQPLSWRVAHADKANLLLKATFGHQFPDIYADHWQDVGNKRAIWVGLRGTPQDTGGLGRGERMAKLAEGIKAKGWPLKFKWRSPESPGAIYLLDDLNTHPLDVLAEQAPGMPESLASDLGIKVTRHGKEVELSWASKSSFNDTESDDIEAVLNQIDSSKAWTWDEEPTYSGGRVSIHARQG